MERIGIPSTSERKLISEPVKVGDFLMTEAVEFEKDDLGLVQEWLGRQMGEHRDEYGFFHRDDKLEKWWEKRQESGEVKMESKAFRFSLPATGPFKEGVKESSILLITTNMGGFCIVSPDVSIKEAEIAFLAQRKRNNQLKELPALKFGSPVKRLQVDEFDELSTSAQLGSWRKQLGKDRTAEIWHLLREAFKSGELDTALKKDAVDQLRHAWEDLCYDHIDAGWTYIRANAETWPSPRATVDVYAHNLPFSGYCVYDNPRKPPRLSFKEIAPGTLGYRMVYEGFQPGRPIFPDEVKDVGGLSGMSSGN